MRQLFFITLVLLVHFGSAQIGGDHVYEFLNVPTSARIGALGGEVVAVQDNDPDVVFSNPSALNATMDNMVTMTYFNYFVDVAYGYASYTKHVEKYGTFSTGFKYADYGQFVETDAAGNELGKFRASEYALMLGYGKQIDSLFSVGVNLKPIFSDLYAYNSLGIAANVSGTYRSKDQSFLVTGVIKHIGTQITTYNGTNETLPLEVQLGISKQLKYVPFRVYMNMVHLNNWKLVYEDEQDESQNFLFGEETTTTNNTTFADELLSHFIVGGEFLPGSSFRLRFGFNFKRRYDFVVDDRPGLVGFSWGIGFKVKKFQVSYGSARYHLGGNANHFTVSTNLSDYYRKGDRNDAVIKKDIIQD